LESATYDAAGQRVQTVAGTSYRTFVYDIFGQLVADYNGSSGATLESENIYRGGQLLAQYKPGTGLSYVLTDVQGSARTTMNNNGSASTVLARHDYLPFGEELAAGIGLRTAGQGYSGADYNRQKYALTERDDVTGLDHTWWRKYESLSGRWTSPDPLAGNIGDPQSFNRYSYTQNDPTNLVDPSGLRPGDSCMTGNGQPGIEGTDGACYAGPTGGVTIHGGGPSPLDDPTSYTFVINSINFRGYVGRGGGGGGGVGAGIGAAVPQNPAQSKRNCTFPTYDQLSATQQGLLDGLGGANAYGSLSDAQKANFLNQTGALAKAGIDLGKALLETGGILTDRLLFAPGTTDGFKDSIVASIANGGFIKDTPVASKHPGMSEFGARQNRTFNALQVGFGPAGAFVDIDRGNPSGGLAGLIVHGGEVLTPGKTDPFAVGKKLGSKVTGYTCK
jgi:RHS repeat-associated protein